MFPLHWSTLWVRLVVMHPWFVQSNNPVKYIFSFIYILQEMLQGQTHSVHFPRSYSSMDTLFRQIFRNYIWSCIMLYAKPWAHPRAVATLSIVIILPAWINTSTRCTVASVTISTGRPGRALSATFERPWENFSTQLWTALCVKHFPP
jgi:hypothetical protein